MLSQLTVLSILHLRQVGGPLIHDKVTGCGKEEYPLECGNAHDVLVVLVPQPHFKVDALAKVDDATRGFVRLCRFFGLVEFERPVCSEKEESLLPFLLCSRKEIANT